MAQRSEVDHSVPSIDCAELINAYFYQVGNADRDLIKPALVVVDGDAVRRNAVSQRIYRHARHVEPYENCEELRRFWPEADVLLLCDEGTALQEVLEVMAEHGRWVPVVSYSAAPEASRIVDAVHLGALDYLAWPFSAEEVSERLKIVADRRRSFLETQRLASLSRQLVDNLSPREREVLVSLAEGASNKIIARALQVSPRTVEVHRANMMGKLGARHVGEAVSIAHRAGLTRAHEDVRGR